MVNYFKYSIICFLSFLLACEETPVEPLNHLDTLTETERSFVGTWTYISIIAAGETYLYADPYMEFNGNGRASLGGNRADLFRRKIKYSDDHTYQIQWVERGDYALGTEDSQNWQPNFGTWEVEGDSLIHNASLYYEVKYNYAFSGNNFSRSSKRYMTEPAGSGAWQATDTISFVERFIKN
ncbi:MAG: hypothetical protein JXR07_13225 [Reichenbachiella sp.]